MDVAGGAAAAGDCGERSPAAAGSIAPELEVETALEGHLAEGSAFVGTEDADGAREGSGAGDGDVVEGVIEGGVIEEVRDGGGKGERETFLEGKLLNEAEMVDVEGLGYETVGESVAEASGGGDGVGLGIEPLIFGLVDAGGVADEVGEAAVDPGVGGAGAGVRGGEEEAGSDVAEPIELPLADGHIDDLGGAAEEALTAADGGRPDDGADGVVAPGIGFVGPFVEDAVRVFDVEIVAFVDLVRVVEIDLKIAEAAFSFHLGGLVVGAAIGAEVGDADEIWEGAAVNVEGDETGFGLVGVERVVEAATEGADVGATETEAEDFPFEAEIVLVEDTVCGLFGKTDDTLAGDGGGGEAGGVRIWEGDEALGLAGLILVGFGDLEGSAAADTLEEGDAFGEHAVAAANNEFGSDAIGGAEAGSEVGFARGGLGITGGDGNVFGVEGADFGERSLGNDDAAGGAIEVVHEAIGVDGRGVIVPTEAVFEG